MRLALAILSATLALADDDTKPRPKLAEATQAIVDTARAAAPEIFADTIIKLVESGKIPQRELQIELLDDAFHSATRAVEPVRLIAIPGTPPDTRETFRSKAGALALDTVSLQARVLRNLLTEDRAKARELFGQMAHPALDPRPCDDAFVADIAPYYEIAAAVAQSSFAPKEKENDGHLQFLTGVLTTARSPNEVAAFAAALQNVTFSKAQREVLLAVIAKKLESVGADYRAYSVSFNTMSGALQSLSDLARANQAGSVDGLLGSFRKYLVVQLTAPRCKPDIPNALGEMEWFRPALTEAEIKPSERKGEPKAHAYFESEESLTIARRFTENQNDRNNSDSLTDFLREISLWTPPGSDVDILHQRGTILQALLQTVKASTERDRIAAMAVDLLANNGAQRQNPAEWMWQVRALAEAIGPSAPALLRRSGNPGLLSYLASLPSSGTSK